MFIFRQNITRERRVFSFFTHHDAANMPRCLRCFNCWPWARNRTDDAEDTANADKAHEYNSLSDHAIEFGHTIEFDRGLLDLIPETCLSYAPSTHIPPLPPYTTEAKYRNEPRTTRIIVMTWLSQIAAQAEVRFLTQREVERVLDRYEEPHALTNVCFVNKHNGEREAYKIGESQTLSVIVDAYHRYSDGAVDFIVNTKIVHA
jgi:hypothetical protein